MAAVTRLPGAFPTSEAVDSPVGSALQTLVEDMLAYASPEYQEFCERHLAHLDEIAYAWFTSAEFDDIIVQTVRSTFPLHEHDHFTQHYRGLLASWASDNAC